MGERTPTTVLRSGLVNLVLWEIDTSNLPPNVSKMKITVMKMLNYTGLLRSVVLCFVKWISFQAFFNL